MVRRDLQISAPGERRQDPPMRLAERHTRTLRDRGPGSLATHPADKPCESGYGTNNRAAPAPSWARQHSESFRGRHYPD
jgi:hypothetical protein